MRILGQELFKLFSRRFILTALAALVVFNAAVFLYSEQKRVPGVSLAKTECFEKSLSVFTNKQALEKLQAEYDELSKLRDVQTSLISAQPLLQGRYSSKEIARLTRKLKAGGYLSYADSIYCEMMLYQNKINEIRAIDGYGDYKQEIEDNAEKMTSISLFADPGSFTYRNAKKTAGDYAAMDLFPMQFENSRGIDAATQGMFTDVFALAFILLCTVALLTQEKENKTLDLLKSMPDGRGTLAASKMGAVFICCLIAVALFYGTDYSLAGALYGFGNLNRPIQGVLGFLGSTWRISVGNYLLWFLLCKLLVFVLWGSVLFTVCVLAKKSVQVYAATAVLVGISCGLYYATDPVSPLSPLKYINLFYFLNTSKLFSNYLNINLFGFPAGFVPVFFTSTLLGAALFSFLSIRAFAGQKTAQFRQKKTGGAESRHKIRGNVSLIRHESYKSFFAGGALLILTLASAFQAAGFRVDAYVFMDINDVFYNRYMTQLEGPVTADTDRFIQNEQKRFDDVTKQLMKTPSSQSAPRTIELSNQLSAQQAFNQVVERYKYLKELQKNTGKRGYLFYDRGHRLLTAAESERSDAGLALFCTVLLIACTVYAFTIEYRSGVIDIIRATRYGRRKLFAVKQSVCMIIAVLCFLIVYLPEYLRVFLSYGTAGLTAPACSLPQLSGMPEGVTLLDYYLLINLVRLAGLFLCIEIVAIASCCAENYIMAALISTAVIDLPLVFSLLNLSLFNCLLLNPVLLSNQLFQNTGTAEHFVSVGFCLLSIAFAVLLQRRLVRKCETS